jgi:CxxC-x17-CxxC domain-containing protein
MAFFKKQNGFGGKKHFNSNRGEGRDFRGGGNRFGGQGNERREMFSAVCATCGRPCEVPFRPTADRPVYCREHFHGKDGAPSQNYAPREERKFNSAKTSLYSAAPKSDGGQMSELKRQLDALNTKIDKVLALVAENKKISTGMPAVSEQSVPDVSLKSIVDKAVQPKKAKPAKVKPASKKAKKVGAKK